jgi:hypothetical protein
MLFEARPPANRGAGFGSIIEVLQVCGFQHYLSTMTEFTHLTWIAVVLFMVVFVLNVLPAFAPPTWMTMSFIGLAIPRIDYVFYAIVAAVAATSGRALLAKISRVLVRKKLLSTQTRQNVDAVRFGLEAHRVVTFGTFLGYSLSPIPSNYLFIAYGLTSLPIARLALPFFIGRAVSYAFWLRTASAISVRLDLDWFESAPYFVIYFVLSQVLLVPVLYGFAHVDWHALIVQKRFKWLKPTTPESSDAGERDP